MTNERVISDVDLSSSLSQMAESTTAAELVRRQGQTKKLKVLSERKLMEWILALLNQHLASKEDSFSDQEKEELLRKTQEKLAERIQQSQRAESESFKAKAELEQAMAQIARSANEKGDQSALDAAIKALRAQLEEAEGVKSDLQQDAFELQDQLQEKLNLLSTTIAEKDKLRDAIRNQMLRSNALVEGVIGLDNQYYSNRHVDGNALPEDAGDDEQFYHDFDVGAAVITTLSQDLEKLRSITGKLGDGSGDQRSLEQDLDLLTQLKSGSLHAMDVAAPISGLVEALAGARIEAEGLDEEVAQATGGQPKPISELPDPDGEPGEVLAGATAVARELASELARNRQRIAALRNLAEDADAARNQTENENEELRAAHQQLLVALAAKAPADVAETFNNQQAGIAAHVAAIANFSAVPSAELKAELQAELRAELQAELKAELQAELEVEREKARAALAQVQEQQQRALEAHRAELARALEAQRQQAEELAASQQRAVARAVVEAARGDERLADTAADLALGFDAESPTDDAYPEQVLEGVHNLTRRKLELERELARAQTEVSRYKAAADEAEQAVVSERNETQRIQRTSAATNAAAAAATAELATAGARVEHMRRELDAALGLVRLAQDEGDAARADASDATAKARALEAKHAERIRTDRMLAGELLTVAKQDDLLADVSTDLSVALDDEGNHGMQHQLSKTVSALAQRQQSLNLENSRLSRDSERLGAEVSESKRNLADTQRSIAKAVIEAGKDDVDLKESVTQLELSIERLRPGEPMPSDILAMLNGALTQLAARKQDLQVERDEMALNGKEIISALTVSRDQREQELRLIRAENEHAQDRVATLESRAAVAESANRQLAEALSRAAGMLPADSQEARVDLELALSQLPDEGEEGIDVPADVAPQIATHGERVIMALADRQRQASTALSRSQDERAKLETELDERAAAVSRLTSDLTASRNDLADSRMQQASAQAVVNGLRADLNRGQNDMKAAAKALAEARSELDRAQERAMTQADELSLRVAEIDGLKARITGLERQVSHSEADIAEHHARGGASSDNLRDELQQTRKELSGEREAAKAHEAEALELREKVESAEARYRRLKDEFSQRLEERDLVIQEKDRKLDGIADKHADISGFEAQVAALHHQVTQANLRIAELDAQTGAAAGATGRFSNVGAELKRAQSDRDLMREQKRSLEADLAESHSNVEELKAQNDELRKEILSIRTKVEQTLSEERSKNALLRDENGRLKADNVGLQTKVRKLSSI